MTELEYREQLIRDGDIGSCNNCGDAPTASLECSCTRAGNRPDFAFSDRLLAAIRASIDAEKAIRTALAGG